MPDWNDYVRRHLPALGLRPEREAEIAAELAAQFSDAYREARSAGLSEAEAETRARAHVTDWNALAAQIREAERAAPEPVAPERHGSWTAGLLHDARYALRGLRRNPVFAAVAALTLAFGIGGNTAIFTVVDHLALRGLPYPGSDRLMDIEHTKTDQPEVEPWCAIANFDDFRRRTQAFETIAAVSPIWNVILSDAGESERMEALYVSGDFFSMLRATPAVGRLFTPSDDDRARPAQVVVLSHSLWMRRFGGARDIVGRVLKIDSGAATVIGVAPADFLWRGEPVAGTASKIDLWLPLSTNPIARSPRTLRFLKVTGRLKAGVSTDQARDEIRRIGDALTAEYPEANRNLRFAGAPLEAKLAARLRPAVLLLIGTVGFVLLMASANVSNLLLARAAARSREVAVRIAIGASAARLFRQLLAESLALAGCGGLLGLVLARVFVALIVGYGPPALMHTAGISLDLRALAFTGAVVFLTALLAGLAPAWRATSGAVGDPLREARAGSISQRRVRSALAVAQLAIALALLIGSGLLIRSLLRVLAVDPGFDPRGVVSISTQLPPGLDGPARTAAYNAIRDRLLAEPGVRSVAAVSRLPLLGQNLASLLVIEGQDNQGHPPEVEFRAATPSYFATMGIPLKSGRLFDDHDPTSLPILLVDETTARRYFAGADPVGKRIRFLADAQGPWFTIVGVVGSTRHFGLEAEPRPTIYRPVAMNPLYAPILVIRTAGGSATQARTLARVVGRAYGSLPAYNVFQMQELVDRSTSERRFLMWLLTAFALAATLLAGVGIYGAMSQSVAQRRREIGVRMALGADPTDALRLVFGEAMRLAAVGIAAGAFLGWAAAMAGHKLLFGVRSADPAVFAVAALVVLLFAAAGCWIPARRATRVDPLITLRDS